MVAVILAFLGLCFGSFINALVWRVHQQEKGQTGRELSILNGRSMCPKCSHPLAVRDLIPVFSWLSLGGRCRYCHQPIDDSPLVEVLLALVFVISYQYWPQALNSGGQRLLLVTWLVSAIGLLALAVYDLRWMLLPNRILYPTFFVAIAGRAGYIAFYSSDKTHSLALLVLSLLVSSGVFWLIFVVSRGRWIGYGDVRLGLVTGALLATPTLSALMIFLASAIGCVAVLPAMVWGHKTLRSKLPYGPLLIGGTFISLLFGNSLIDWYKRLFGL